MPAPKDLEGTFLARLEEGDVFYTSSGYGALQCEVLGQRPEQEVQNEVDVRVLDMYREEEEHEVFTFPQEMPVHILPKENEHETQEEDDPDPLARGQVGKLSEDREFFLSITYEEPMVVVENPAQNPYSERAHVLAESKHSRNPEMIPCDTQVLFEKGSLESEEALV